MAIQEVCDTLEHSKGRTGSFTVGFLVRVIDIPRFVSSIRSVNCEGSVQVKEVVSATVTGHVAVRLFERQMQE